MLTSETTITHKVIKHVVTFDTDNIPLEFIQLDFERFKRSLKEVGFYNANKNATFIFIRTDAIATFYTALVDYCNRECINYVNRSKRVPTLPEKCENIRDIIYSFKYRNDLGTLIQYLIMIFNKIEKIVTCNPVTFTLESNVLTLEIKNTYVKEKNNEPRFPDNRISKHYNAVGLFS